MRNGRLHWLVLVVAVAFSGCGGNGDDGGGDDGGDTPLTPQFLNVQVEFCQFNYQNYFNPALPPQPPQPNTPFGGCFVTFDGGERTSTRG